MNRLLAVALCLVLTATAACSGDARTTTILHVLAGSELTDLKPILDDLRAETGIELDMDYQSAADTGTSLTPGEYHHDLAWLSTDRYFQLRLKKSGYPGPKPMNTRIMSSPIVVGVKPDVAAKLRQRAPGGQLSWADFGDAAASGSLRFAMADPAKTASGLSALVGVATAAAGTGAALLPGDVACDRLQGFRAGQTVTADSSTGLLDQFARQEKDVDAIIGYESSLLSLNASGKLATSLELVYPRDGIMQSEYPLLLLDPTKREAYDRVTAWLKSPQAQRKIMERTLRRPFTEGMALDARLPKSVGNSLYFPNDQDVVDRLLADYANPQGNTPGQVIFLLDFSGSMKGPRIAGLREAFAELSGAGAAEFARFSRGEKLTVVRFGGTILGERDFTVNGPPDLEALRAFISTDEFDSTTAIWSALGHAYAKVAEIAKTDPGRPVSIVLMTDGESNAGIGLDEFLRGHPAGATTFTVRSGEANAGDLDRVAKATGGHLVDATATSLLSAFKEIRGCR